ncbi:MAG: hypothetical protein RJB38_752 [Pseudomonadota bacterium]
MATPTSADTQRRLIPNSDNPLDVLLEHIRDQGVSLYPAQEEAILELFSGKNVILNTPTGSGKSLVALALHYLSLCEGKRSIYTCPIKALVNEKFLALCRDFGPENVGMITGDASVNPDAPILCCTAEILAIDALRWGKSAPVNDVIMDEFHYYSDRDRGWAWQIPLLCLPQTRFLLMSATLGDTTEFEKRLTQLNARESVVIRSTQRPVPLEFKYSDEPLHDVTRKLVEQGQAPVYVVNFTQRECAERAQDFLSIDFCSKEQKRQIADLVASERFESPYGKEFSRLIRHGVGIHHAGLLPKYRILVEKLAQKGLLKVILGTDTLGVGVNVPIRTVLFTKLCKFDGEKTSILSVRDFKQIAGRAGRKGFDDQGFVVVQAPEHVIENLKNEAKAGSDPKKLKKLVKKGPPPKGYAHWDKSTFQKLIDGEPEPLVSRFHVNHAVLLHVLSRGKNDAHDCCQDMARLIRDSHESPVRKNHWRRQSWILFRALVDRKIVELNPLRLNLDLQEDFSLHHALSLYMVDAIEALDSSKPEYSLEILSLVESILENPDTILRKQVDRLKTEKLAELKMEGVEYEQRMEELEKIEHPKPMADFIYTTFNAFAEAHPWVTQETIHPKSIAREMYEQFHSFGEYIREYGLQRSEGLLLRYLSEVYKTLLQNVPELSKNDELFAMTDYFREIIRSTDSSLLTEWERLRNPNSASSSSSVGPESLVPVEFSIDSPQRRREFQTMIRNEVFKRVRALSLSVRAVQNLGTPVSNDTPSSLSREASAALRELQEIPEWLELVSEFQWTPEALLSRVLQFHRENGPLLTSPEARAPRWLKLHQGHSDTWTAEQVLLDQQGHHDWVARFEIRISESRSSGRAVLRIVDFAPLSEISGTAHEDQGTE